MKKIIALLIFTLFSANNLYAANIEANNGLIFAENNNLWKSLDGLNEHLSSYNQYIPHKSLVRYFAKAIKILTSRSLSDEFEILRSEAFVKNDFTKVDYYVKRAKPCIE